MQAVSFKRHRFPPDVIRQAVWPYFRFTLSLRDVEEMLAERGIEQTTKPSAAGPSNSADFSLKTFADPDPSRPAAGTWTRWS
jgi:hypothetical protein